MKGLLFILVLYAAFGRANTVINSSMTNVGLEDAKKFAIEHNQEVHALRRGVEETRSKSGRARSHFFPTLGVAGGADTQVTSTGKQAVSVGFLYGDYNLFSGFEDTYRLQIANLEIEKSEIKLKRAEFRVGLEVERVFHLYLFKKGAINLRNEALKLNESHRKIALQRKASGISSESDVMEFDLRDSLLRSDLLLIEQELEEARSNLKRLLGEEVGSKMEPVGRLQHQHIKGALTSYVKRIKDESEPVLVASKDVASATIESKVGRSRWLPNLDLHVHAGYVPLDERPARGDAAFAATVLAKWDLFSGFDSLWERRELEARRQKAEHQLKGALLNGMVDMEVSFRKIRTVQSRVDLEEKNVDRSEKYYRSVLSEYRRGVKNSADVKVAAEQLYDARLRGEEYKFQFLDERIALEKALGGPVDTEIVHEGHEN